MINIVIIGTGAVASELQWFPFRIKGYIEYEDNREAYWKRYQLKRPIIGDIDNYEIQQNDRFVVGMTNIEFRWKMINRIKARGGIFINIIHPEAIVQSPIKGEGNIIHPYVIIGANAQIGSYNHFCPQTIVGHDCIIGDNNVLSATIVCGHTTIGNHNYFAIKTAIVPHIKIGDYNGVHAGMTVDKDIDNHVLITQEPMIKVVVSNYHRK